MDSARKAYAKTLTINHYSPEKVPWRRLGQYLYRIVEDGTNTQMRLAAIESLLPPRTMGPVFHFHEMHDEGFLIKSGTVRFHSPGRPDVDAKAGDMVVIPIRLPHRFSNPFDEEAVFVNTITPGFFVRYFEHLEELIGEGIELTPEVNKAALLRFATLPLDHATIEQLEAESRESFQETQNGKLTNGEANGGAPKTPAIPELDLANKGGKGVSEYGVPV
ncbi:hypothetical protein ACLMJK_004800 [Lecanora helva]